MAGALRDDAALDALAGEGEIADEIQHLVAHELVGETQRTFCTPSLVRMMAHSGEAPRMRPMSRSLASSSRKPKVRAGAICVA